MKKFKVILFFIAAVNAFGQKDTSLMNWFKGGEFNGHFRYFNSITINEGQSEDYLANAIGGGLRYQTQEYKRFTAAISGYYIFNVYSSDLVEIDSVSSSKNRYEIGLFDIEHPENKGGMDRLEELYIQYHKNGLNIKLGRQLFDSPLVNGQDGRMRPTELQGITSSLKRAKHLIQFTYFWAISPRSTTRWSSIEHAIGIWPQGYDAVGNKLNYHGTLDSKGLFILSNEFSLKRTTLSLWSYWIENIHETNYIELKQTIHADSNYQFKLSLQGILQYGTVTRGSSSYLKTNHRSQVIGMKAVFSQRRNDMFIAGNYFFNGDPFLFPREFGREPFYAVFSRERLEGCANAIALALGNEIQWNKNKLLISLAYYNLPDPSETQKNRYKLPSMFHLNLKETIHFEKYLHGIDMSWLISVKLAEKRDLSYESLANKADLIHSSLVLNYHF